MATEQLENQIKPPFELHRTGRLAEAEAGYRSVLLINPENHVAHHLMGSILVQRGQLRQAIDFHRRAVELSPQNAAYHHNLGCALTGLKQTRDTMESITCFQRAIELRPNFPEALAALGSAYENVGMIDEAIATFETGIRVKLEFRLLYHLLPEAQNVKAKVMNIRWLPA
jgi:protein O-GlcNAc transferase